jgi:CDP-diacylglycerol---glycerol-3-phosphate 3-phosphatidyltransferase
VGRILIDAPASGESSSDNDRRHAGPPNKIPRADERNEVRPPSRLPVPAGLVRRWLVWLPAAVLVLAGVGSWVGDSDPSRWGRWLPPSLLVAGYGLTFSRANLGYNYRRGEGRLLSYLGPGTGMTMLRGLLIAPLAGMLFLPRLAGVAAWIPALLYTSAALLDQFDGYAARRSNHATLLGEMLDLELDGLGVLLAVSVAIHEGHLPLIFLTVGLARYVFLLWALMLRALGRSVRPIPESLTRRSIAGLQMGFLTAALWPIAPRELILLAGWMFAVPFFASFGRDMLVMAGFADADSPGYLAIRSWARRMGTRLVPPVLRAGLVVLLAPILGGAWQDLRGRVAAFASGGVEHPEWVAPGLLALASLALVFIALGFLGRTGSVLMVLAIGLSMIPLGADPSSLAVIGMAVGVLILGTGPASLWAPEGAWLGRRGGRPRQT